MDLLDCFVGLRIHQITRRECDWLLEFEDRSTLLIECLWRLLRSGRVVLTSEDHGEAFGRTAQIDAANCFNSQLTGQGQAVTSVTLTEGTLDLAIAFDDAMLLQIIPVSTGYEAWSANTRSTNIVAVAGGELTIFRSH